MDHCLKPKATVSNFPVYEFISGGENTQVPWRTGDDIRFSSYEEEAVNSESRVTEMDKKEISGTQRRMRVSLGKTYIIP